MRACVHICTNRNARLWVREQTIYSQSIFTALIPHAAVLHGAVLCRLGVSVHAGNASMERDAQMMKLGTYIGQQTEPLLPHGERSPVWGGERKVLRFLLPIKCTRVVLREISP